MIIKSLFLPDSWISQDIIGIEIGKYQVSACQLSKKGSITKIKKTVSVAIEANSENSYEEQTVLALKQLLTHVSGNQIRVSISNNHIFFKELTVPFLDYQKIKLILGYEIESSLPFPLNEAVYDFIITKQDKIKAESTVLIAITQKSLVNHIINLIEQTGTKIKLGAITVDLLGIYSVYNLWSQNSEKKEPDLLLDLGKNSITITYLYNNRPLLVRNLPYGINTIINKIMHTSGKQYHDVVEKLFRVGLDEQDYLTAFNKLSEDITFTINSFKLQLSKDHKFDQILICESATEIKNIAHYFTEKTNITSNVFEPNKNGLHKTLSIAENVFINPNNITCIGAAVTVYESDNFNLLSHNQVDQVLIRYQIVTIGIITAMIFGIIYGIGFVKNNNLNKSLVYYNQSAIEELKKAFPGIEAINLATAVNDAESKVNREKKIWFSFSNQNRYSSLKYLQALSSALNVKKLNLDLKKLIIKDNTMSLQGTVENNEDIFPFEQALTSIPIFKSVTIPQSTSFTIQIILKQNDKDGM